MSIHLTWQECNKWLEFDWLGLCTAGTAQLQRLQLPESCSTQVTQALYGLYDRHGMEAVILCCTQKRKLAGVSPVITACVGERQLLGLTHTVYLLCSFVTFAGCKQTSQCSATLPKPSACMLHLAAQLCFEQQC